MEGGGAPPPGQVCWVSCSGLIAPRLQFCINRDISTFVCNHINMTLPGLADAVAAFTSLRHCEFREYQLQYLLMRPLSSLMVLYPSHRSVECFAPPVAGFGMTAKDFKYNVCPKVTYVKIELF